MIAKTISDEAASWKKKTTTKERREKKNISWRPKQGEEGAVGTTAEFAVHREGLWGGGGVTARSVGIRLLPCVGLLSSHTHTHTCVRTC